MKFLILLLLPIFVFANTGSYHFVHFKTKDKKVINELANHIHIDKIIESSIYSTVNQFEFDKVKVKFKKYLVETHPLHGFDYGSISTTSEEIEYPRKDEDFHTYKEMMDLLKRYSRDYSNIVELFSFGTSVEGRDIPAIRISSTTKTKNSFIPQILLTGSHHAREHLSTEVPLKLIGYLLESYGKDAEVTRLIDNREIVFVPMLNPDGAMHDIKGRKYKMWRKNRTVNYDKSFGVDLNRNYDFEWGTGGSSRSPRSDVYMGPKPFSEPETQAVKKYVEDNANIRVLLSFHTFSELILYPWGKSYDGIGGKDQRVFEKMAKTMSQWNGYKPQQSSQLYITTGDTCDWAYGVHNIFCFTFELSPKSQWGGGFYPGASAIPKAFKANIKPVLYLIDKAGAPYDVIKRKSVL